METFEAVKAIVVSTLGISAPSMDMTPDTPLLGSWPELDSMGAMHLITALEEHFGIEFSDDEVTARTFKTLGTLAEVVREKGG